jgi:hypothetical protein
MSVHPCVLFAVSMAAVLATLSAHASSSEDSAFFASGTQALAEGRPGDAIANFEALADRGVTDPAASFDRGLAYANRIRVGAEQPGDLGRAALGFAEARELTKRRGPGQRRNACTDFDPRQRSLGGACAPASPPFWIKVCRSGGPLSSCCPRTRGPFWRRSSRSRSASGSSRVAPRRTAGVVSVPPWCARSLHRYLSSELPSPSRREASVFTSSRGSS